MKLMRLETIFTLGLAAKAGAVLVALVLAWPIISAQTQTVQAQEKKDPQAKEQKAKAPGADKMQNAGQAGAKPAPGAPAAAPSPELDSRVVRLLEERRAKLALEEERLARQRKDLETMRAQVEERLGELRKVQEALEQLVATEQKQRRKRVLQLVKVLSNMRPASAAAVVEKLDDQMSVEIFKLMQSRQAGKVMAAMPPRQAARIGAKIAEQKKTQKAGKLARQAAGERQQAPPPPPQR